MPMIENVLDAMNQAYLSQTPGDFLTAERMAYGYSCRLRPGELQVSLAQIANEMRVRAEARSQFRGQRLAA